MCSVLCRTIVYRVTLVQSSEFSLILPSLFYCTVPCDDVHSFPFLPYSLSTYLSLFHTVSLHLSSLISFSLSLSPCLSSSSPFRYVRMGERPDAALYTLFLRALLQQNKWQEGMLLFRRMLVGKEAMGRPNHHTLNCLLQHQVRSANLSLLSSL